MQNRQAGRRISGVAVALAITMLAATGAAVSRDELLLVLSQPQALKSVEVKDGNAALDKGRDASVTHDAKPKTNGRIREDTKSIPKDSFSFFQCKTCPPYEGDSSNNKRTSWYDLVQQARMAIAAEEMARWTYYMLFIGGGQVFLMAVQWYLLNRTLQATRDTANTAREALTSGQRAFVFVDRFRAMPYLAHNIDLRNWIFIPVLRNSGSTPARHLIYQVTVEHRNDDLPEDFAFPSPSLGTGIHNVIPSFIGAEAELQIMPTIIHVDALDKIQSGQQRCFIHGWIEYDDVLQGTSRHRTEFCYELMIIADPTVKNPDHFSFHVYRRYNGADDECMYQPSPYPFEKKHDTSPLLG